jgi:predicted ATPase
VTQLTRALDLIATLPSAPAQRREQIKLQVALITPLMHIKGYAAPDTIAAVEVARRLIEHAEALGEHPEDPLLLFAVLYGLWVANFAPGKGDAALALASQFLTLAEKEGASLPLMVGNNLLGSALLHTGKIADGRAHLDRGIALYDPAEYLAAGMRFGEDARAAPLYFRARPLWMLGYPAAARAEVETALKEARESGHAVSLFFALTGAAFVDSCSGDFTAANKQLEELLALAEEKGAMQWKVVASLNKGSLLALTGNATSAIQHITSAIAAYRSTGTTLFVPWSLCRLASAYAQARQFDNAWRCIGEASTIMETSKERWCEGEVHRTAGEMALMSPEPDAVKAESYFERALAIARQQQAKSWELRAATSLARLWRDQGKVQQARELLAPVYGWFTEGSTRAI